MSLEGLAVVVDADNVDTDVLYPTRYCDIYDDPRDMRRHLFEGFDRSLRDKLVGDTVLVVGKNFGCGSSRQEVALAMRESGVRALVGCSFARISYRNCITFGLMAVVCPPAVEAAHEGDAMAVKPHEGIVAVGGASYSFPRLPAIVLDIVAAGGLVDWAKAELASGRS